MNQYEIAVLYHPDLEMDLDKATAKVDKIIADNTIQPGLVEKKEPHKKNGQAHYQNCNQRHFFHYGETAELYDPFTLIFMAPPVLWLACRVQFLMCSMGTKELVSFLA